LQSRSVVMGRRIEDVRAWQVAHAFTQAVCRLLKGSAVAAADMRFSVGLFRAARAAEAAVAEGIRQGADQASARALGEAGHQLAAALVAIEDGIDRGYFSKPSSQPALDLGREAARMSRSLATYLERCGHSRRRGRARLARDAL
jgi:23S rRNA-intervening sequence protein